MDEKERRRRAIEGLDAMRDPFIGYQLVSEMFEDSRRERLCDGDYSFQQKHLTLPEIWRDITSVYN
mgnify:CR=1 FL=1